MSDAPAPFSVDYHVTWRDLDALMHMGNTAYLDYAANTRVMFFERLGIGPITSVGDSGLALPALRQEISYHRELRYEQRFRVDVQLSGLSDPVRKVGLVNRFTNDDGDLCASVTFLGIWMDLNARKAIVAPPDIAAVLQAAPRSEDFEILP